MFRAPHHEAVWNAITGLAESGAPISPTSVMAALRDAGELRGLMTTEYLTQLVGEGTNPHDAGHFANTVRAEAQRRRMRAFADKVSQASAVSAPEDFAEVMARLTGEWQSLAAGEVGTPARKRKLPLTPASEIEMRPTSWLWDTTPDGAPPTSQGRFPVDSLILAAGKPGLGKSQFGVWIAAELTNGTLPRRYV